MARIQRLLVGNYAVDDEANFVRPSFHHLMNGYHYNRLDDGTIIVHAHTVYSHLSKLEEHPDVIVLPTDNDPTIVADFLTALSGQNAKGLVKVASKDINSLLADTIGMTPQCTSLDIRKRIADTFDNPCFLPDR